MAKFRQYESGIGVVWSDSNDPIAFCELVVQQQAAQATAIVLIYYSSDALNPHELVDYFNTHCSDLNYCGCSTGGEISPEGMQDCGVLAIMLPASNFSVLSKPIENIHKVGMNNIAQQAAEQRILFEELCDVSNIESTFAITLIDGLTYSEESVTAALHRGLGDISLVGGSAGDNFEFKKTTQLCNGRVYTNAVVLILIKSDLPFRLCTENNFVPTDHKLVVTDADPDTRTVFEFNAEPAALAYADAIGVNRAELDPQCFASNAMVVRVGGEYHCRAVQRVNSDDSLDFFSAIDTGVVLTIAKTEGMVRSMQRSIENIEYGMGKIDFMMGFECILRKLDARQRNVIERIEDLYMENNIVAFNSYGEQYQSMHINQTFTGVAFGFARNSIMSAQSASDAEILKLRKINKVLVDRVERSMDQQGHGFSLFQTAINLESQIDRRTSELTSTLAHLNRANHELETAKNLAEKANLNKSQVLAAASHDVLQPLNAAQLLISSLASVQTCDEGTRLCGQIERSLDTMTTLLNSLLYMSRLDAGAVQPEWQSVSLLTLFGSIESDFQPVADAKEIDLRVRHNNLFVHSDPTMLRRIVQNMVANAIEYTSEGGVLLSANRITDHIHIRVADTGCGIDSESYKTIFEEFYRGSSSQQSIEQQNSAGLGLAIVARMIDTLKHTITVNSEIDRGSCFRLSLLAAESRAQVFKSAALTSRTDSMPKLEGLVQTRILFVENDFVVLDAMDTLLKQWGCDYRLASSTQEALSSVVNKAWQPDLILADQHLDAKETGTSTIELVRTLIGESVPAIIVTANPSKQLAKDAEGLDIEVMLKPIKPAQLRALLSHQLAQPKVQPVI